nr:MAG TPA: hypothetical protein [Caudoviricetes sp.]
MTIRNLWSSLPLAFCWQQFLLMCIENSRPALECV